MDLNKTQLIGYIAIVVIVVSLATIGMKMTGFATTTDTAIINVTIQSSAAINFTTDFVNFGSGSVDAGQSSATVNTEGTLTGGTGWSATNNFTLENIGNVNVSLGLKSDKLASSFIRGTSPSFAYKVINNTEIYSCDGNNASTYIDFNTENTQVCSNFPFDNSKDEIIIAIQLVIPSDSVSGTSPQTATITATGTYG